MVSGAWWRHPLTPPVTMTGVPLAPHGRADAPARSMNRVCSAGSLWRDICRTIATGLGIMASTSSAASKGVVTLAKPISASSVESALSERSATTVDDQDFGQFGHDLFLQCNISPGRTVLTNAPATLFVSPAKMNGTAT